MTSQGVGNSWPVASLSAYKKRRSGGEDRATLPTVYAPVKGAL